MADTIKLQTNVPEIIALQFADGLPCQSQYSGDQVLFTLTDGRKLYVAPFIADKIRAAGIGAQTPFSLCKREVMRGNKRTIEYEVKNLSDASAPVRADAPAESHQVIPQPPKALNGNGNGNGHPPAAPAAAPEPDPNRIPTIETTLSAVFARMGVYTIQAVQRAEEEAHKLGMTDFTFGEENVQKLWATLFIAFKEATFGGRR